MNQKERWNKTIKVTSLLIAAFLAIALFVMKGPLDMSCKVYQITGLSCSGCGTTRMVEAILHGHMYQAFRYNPFLFLSVPTIAILYIIGAYRYIRYESSNDWILPTLILYAILLVGFGIIRNIPVFHWLLPTSIY